MTSSGGRTLCAWWPEWPLHHSHHDGIAPPGDLIVVEAGEVVVATDPVAARGVHRGMPRRAAESLAPDATVVVRDRGEEMRRFEAVVRVVEERVPKVEVVEPGLVLVAISGAVRYHGGEAALLTAIVGDLAPIAPMARLGVASGPFAARVAALDAQPGGDATVVDDDVAFLAGRDLSVLPGRDVAATFRWLGIGTLGELARLPREAVASRFGDAGIEAHRLASGETAGVAARAIPPDFEVAAAWEDPLVSLEQVGFAARRLGGRLMEGMRALGVAPRSVGIVAEAADGTTRERVWRSPDPLTEAAVIDRVTWQVRAWVEASGVAGGVVGLRLVPHEVSGDGRQLGLFVDTAASLEAERTLAHIQGTIGPERVRASRPQGGRDPGDRVAWATWGEGPPTVERDLDAPWPGRVPGPSPALVPPEPVPFTVEWDGGIPTRVRLRSRWVEVLSWAGPWRRTGRWWQREGSVDRYQLVTSAGAFLCEVADGGGTFLVGVYD